MNADQGVLNSRGKMGGSFLGDSYCEEFPRDSSALLTEGA